MNNELTPIDAALEILLGSLTPLSDTREVDLDRAVGRVAAADLYAPVDVPGSDNSAMDGYAVNAADLLDIPCTLAVSQRIRAGSVGGSLQSSTAARIFTGAPLPSGADAVVMQENCELSENSVKVLQAVITGENVRRRGEDISHGAVLFRAGHRLRVQDMTVLASAGIATLEVVRPLRVALLTTGDELVRPGTILQPGQIYNSNFYAITSLLEALGVEVLDFGIVADNLNNTVSGLRSAAAEADCLVTTGGVSVGEEDHVKAAVEQLGSLDLWKLAIKPGKPFAFGRVLGKPFFGLPGNPVSAFVTFLLMVRPALLTLAGAGNTRFRSYALPAGFELAATSERQEYLRVCLVDGKEMKGANNINDRQENKTGSASPVLLPFESQSSGIGSSLSGADGLVVVPAFTSVSQGDILQYIPFNELIG